MNRHSRFTAALLCIFFALASACTLSVYADNEDGNPDDGQSSYAEPSEGGGQSSYDDGQSSYAEPSEGGGQSSYDDGGGGQTSYDDGGGQTSYDGGGQTSYSGGGSGGGTYYGDEGKEYSTPEDVYVCGDQTYTPPASTPSTTAALYDTSKEKFDDKTLSKNDWKSIKDKLSNSNASEINSGVVDFSDMQDVASEENNGHWLLIIGIALTLLSLAGFGYYIYSSVSRRKKTAPVKSGAEKHSGGRYRDENDDYDDEFSTGEKHVKSKIKNDKPKNGTRYK